MHNLVKQVQGNEQVLAVISEMQELGEHSVLSVLQHFRNEPVAKIAYRIYAYVNREMIKHIDTEQIGDCKAGCDYCCHLRVSTSPFEVLGIYHYMKVTMTESQIAEILYAIEEGGYLEPDLLETDTWVKRKIPCVFLQNRKCAIYKFRPMSCRAMHSFSSAACKEGCEERKIVEYPINGTKKFAYDGLMKGIEMKMAERYGITYNQLELHRALHIAFMQPKTSLAVENANDPFDFARVYI